MNKRIAGSFRSSPIWWPGWLYELFPFLYAVAGISAILHFGTPAGYAAGALLLLAALLIQKMRSDYRRLDETIRLARDLTAGTGGSRE